MNAQEEMRRCEVALAFIQSIAKSCGGYSSFLLEKRDQMEDEFLRWREVDELERAVKPVGQSETTKGRL